MATNVTISTIPEQWSSAYDDIIFLFDFDDHNISSTSEPSTGLTRITISGTFNVVPSVNDFINIDSGVYAGTWKVYAATTTTVDIVFTFISNQTTGSLKNMRLPTFSLYKGFKATEEFPTDLPYTLVTNFKQGFNSDLQLSVNLSAVLRRIFTIEEPDLNSGVAFSMFNAYRLVWDTDNSTDYNFVLNSSIPTQELNESYIETGQYLCSSDQPVMWGCGISFMIRFVDGFPILEVFNGATQVVAGFSNAFQTNQFSQGYDIN